MVTVQEHKWKGKSSRKGEGISKQS